MQIETFKRHRPTLVVNLFGAPGAGKSTAAAYIFALLKMAGINAELVTEFAKDVVWEEAKEPFNTQAYIFGQQYFRQNRCNGKVDVIVTDSPLLLSVIYNRHPDAGFTIHVFNSFNTFENRNYYLNRTHQFDESGRIHSEEESDTIANKIKFLLRNYSVPYIEVDSTEESYRNIANEIIRIIKGVTA